MKIFVLTKLGVVISLMTLPDTETLPLPWVEKDAKYVEQWQKDNPVTEAKEPTPEEEKAALLDEKAALEAKLAEVDAKVVETEARISATKIGKP